MKPTIGRIVHYTFPEAHIGSFSSDCGQSQTVPAIIVAVWSDEYVNVRVFPDSSGPSVVVTSVPLKNEHCTPEYGHYWEWPARD